ncbi:MAG: response regulator [Candidatus Omnitrophica bacterium]|nr:response regulator [Candidatus Omnitrophota bacterium]
MSKRVLIVDDETCFRNVLEYSLEKAGYITSIAVNGQEAMELLRKEKPHIMLLDINMPVMDEDLVAEKIKNKLANDYMIKPVEIEVLFEKMDNLMGSIA